MSTMRRRPYVTTRTHEVFATAHDLADRLGHDVTPVHIAIGLIGGRPSLANGILHSRGIPIDSLERELEAHLPPSDEPRIAAGERDWTAGDEHVIEQAAVEGRALGAEFVGCEHVLLAFLRDHASAPGQVLTQHGIRFDDARDEVLRAYNARPLP